MLLVFSLGSGRPRQLIVPLPQDARFLGNDALSGSVALVHVPSSRGDANNSANDKDGVEEGGLHTLVAHRGSVLVDATRGHAPFFFDFQIVLLFIVFYLIFTALSLLYLLSYCCFSSLTVFQFRFRCTRAAARHSTSRRGTRLSFRGIQGTGGPCSCTARAYLLIWNVRVCVRVDRFLMADLASRWLT